MTDISGHIADCEQVEQLLSEATTRKYSRRQAVVRGLALGLSIPAIKTVLASPVFAQDASASPAAGGPVDVPIVGKQMSFDDIKAAIAEEKEVNVANWTYAASDQLVARFQQYVKDVYGEEIKVNYGQSQQPSTYLTDLFTAVGSGDNSPWDVMAIEENYWAEVQLRSTQQSTKLMEDFLPSGLIPNADRVLDNLKHVPTSIAFQASATPGINYNKNNVDFLTDWKDLADERLKGKLLMWLPGDITGGGVLLGLAASLGKDYKDPAQMQEAIDFAVNNIGPNVVKYTAEFAEAQQLYESGVVDVVTFWNSMARLEFLNGHEEAAFLVAASGQYAVNGYLWIPVKPAHPVLAQLFIDWRLGDDAQFPDIESWGITKGAWAELQEGFLGPSYEGLVPDWIKDVYFTYFPTIEQLSTNYKTVDWAYLAEHSKEWYDKWLEGIGL
ncbi:MAG: Bacterial extracellular solute-binding protein [Thermomicrobiales bacterium]|nr:Bacterial extracellular solute-binding protein [Thermomicrobiales bacterium]